MAASKTTKPRTTQKKTTTAKAAPAAKAKAQADVEPIFARIRHGFAEAGSALRDSGAIMDEKRRDLLLTLIENAQENADATFDAFREAMDAESLNDSIKVQRDALRTGIERNVAQVREFASLTLESGRESVAPVTDYVSTLRTKARGKAA